MTTQAEHSSTDHREELRGLVRRFLAEAAGPAEVRRVMETEAGYEPRVWRGLGDLGVKGIAVPERYGGPGLDLPTLGVVLKELGRSLYCGPFFSSRLAPEDDGKLPGERPVEYAEVAVADARGGCAVSTSPGATAAISTSSIASGSRTRRSTAALTDCY